MASPIRLFSAPGRDPLCVRFFASFPAPRSGEGGAGAAATLDVGEGPALDLGFLVAPTDYNWRETREVLLAEHAYSAPGAFRAALKWGRSSADTQAVAASAAEAEAVAAPDEGAAPAGPTADLAVEVAAQDPLRCAVTVRAAGLGSGQRLRLDGGAGQVYWLGGPGAGNAPSGSWVLSYAKAGDYVVALDLLDAAGFWLSTLAESGQEMTLAAEDQVADPLRNVEVAAVEDLLSFDVPPAAVTAEPWYPYRTARPAWGRTAAYARPGGAVTRYLSAANYLSFHAETVVNGTLWYQTAGKDWVPGSSMALFNPSPLRGVELDTPAPPPQPPPPPTVPPEEPHYGVITTRVNVRAQPGVRGDNPPIGVVVAGTSVTIVRQETVAGATWYCIGTNRWVHGEYVRLVGAPPVTPPPPPPSGDSRRGMVTAAILNVRAAPGVRAANPPVDRLHAGQEVTIYEEQTTAGALWYRIGETRWVSAQWVRILPKAAAEAPAGAAATRAPAGGVLAADRWSLPVGWVTSPVLNVRARPGTEAGNPPIGEVTHNQPLAVLEARRLGATNWYRIGNDRWVDAAGVGVARARQRPSAISANEYWVSVCLAEQTLVAYEGDRPVYCVLAATGLPGTPTVQGVFRTWRRHEATNMAGPGYNIEDVTWTCYFYSGYALHTAYWHDSFGSPRSHGCVNLSPYDAWWLFRWSAAGGPKSPAVYVYWA